MEGSNCGVQVSAHHHKRFLCAAKVLPEPAPPLRAGLLLPDSGTSHPPRWLCSHSLFFVPFIFLLIQSSTFDVDLFLTGALQLLPKPGHLQVGSNTAWWRRIPPCRHPSLGKEPLLSHRPKVKLLQPFYTCTLYDYVIVLCKWFRYSYAPRNCMSHWSQ